jgi:serpin B
MKRIILLVAALAMLSSASCTKLPANNPYKPIDISTKSAEYIKQGNSFAINFLEKVDGAAKEDYIISPLSMQFLLGMILDGAQGQTATEICTVLGYGAGETAEVNQYCLNMLRQLPDLDKQTTLKIANAIVVDDGYPLKDQYKKDVAHYYDAEVTNMDFSDVEGSTKKINKWCSDHTNKLIPKVLDEVDPSMLAYLMNALYFKSQWKEKFEKADTADEAFTYDNGTKGKVKMMKNREDFMYTKTDDYQAVRLPYGNGAFAMTVLLPAKGKKVTDVIAALKKMGDWKDVYYDMVTCDVDLWLPRFETKYHVDLNDILSEMGMPSAFLGGVADFSAMSDYALCLSFVMQDAIIKVDEEGTEAAAVSMAGMEKNAAMPGEKVVFHADRPFLYVISETSTGAILFTGRYSGK